jgi:hypothetical protein
MRSELSFTYGSDIHPVAGKCTACGEQMPAPPSHPHDNVDTILWFSQDFLIHHQLKHSAPHNPETADEAQPSAQ